MPFEYGSGFRCPCGFYARKEETLKEHAPRCRPNRRLLLYKPDRTFHTREEFVKRRLETIRKYTGSVEGRGIPSLDSPPTSDEETNIPRRCLLKYTFHDGKTDSDSEQDPSPLTSDTESDRMFLDEMPQMMDPTSSSRVGSTAVETNEPLLFVAPEPDRMELGVGYAIRLVERKDFDPSFFNKPKELAFPKTLPDRGDQEP